VVKLKDAGRQNEIQKKKKKTATAKREERLPGTNLVQIWNTKHRTQLKTYKTLKQVTHKRNSKNSRKYR
jgi:hypothetical protein